MFGGDSISRISGILFGETKTAFFGVEMGIARWPRRLRPPEAAARSIDHKASIFQLVFHLRSPGLARDDDTPGSSGVGTLSSSSSANAKPLPG